MTVRDEKLTIPDGDSGTRRSRSRSIPLRLRLGIGAALLGAGTLVVAGILWLGMGAVSERLETAIASETRMARYAILSQQAATFLVIATEAVQTGQSAETRADRLSSVEAQMAETFLRLRADVEAAVAAAQSYGLDAQSRYGTQSLGLARMEAMLAQTLRGLAEETDDRSRLRAHIDTFASSFDPLLNQAVNTEILFRNAILEGIGDLRGRLTATAAIIALATVAAVAAFYLGLIRPQFRRLERLGTAARAIGREEFAIALPDTRDDEIGQLYSETRRMAAALADRAETVRTEWERLNDTIAERTEALRKANARLSEIDENRRRFFADISHELRTPLTVILMEAQLGRQGSGDAAQSLATIEARAARLNRRIDDLLRVARSDSGRLALDPQPVVLADLMNAAVEEVAAEVDAAGMRLDQGTVPEAMVQADPNWLRQVLVGLVRNAIRHARGGGVVALTARVDGQWVELGVADNGPGIPDAEQEAAFARFGQGGGSAAHGFGLGLPLARWVIESLGGKIAVESPLPRDTALGDAPGTKIAIRLRSAEG